MNRFPFPKEEPEMPRRKGVLELEEVWLGIEGDNFRFFLKPDLAPVRVKLRFDFVLLRGRDDPIIRTILWQSPGEEKWEEIPCTYAPQHLHFAAMDLLEDPEVERSMQVAIENAKLALPRYQSVFEEAIARAAR